MGLEGEEKRVFNRLEGKLDIKGRRGRSGRNEVACIIWSSECSSHGKLSSKKKSALNSSFSTFVAWQLTGMQMSFQNQKCVKKKHLAPLVARTTELSCTYPLKHTQPKCFPCPLLPPSFFWGGGGGKVRVTSWAS